MATLNISKEKFEKEIGKLDENMQERIIMFGCPIEALNDEELILEIFPNRPDLLSYQNFKNSFLSFLGKNKGLNEADFNKPLKDYEINIDKSVESVRPYTACAIVKNLKFDDSKIKEIIDIQEKLHTTVGRNRKKAAIGIYPLEKIKLPISYKALLPEKIKFQPLGFSREINGKQILSQHPAGRDYGHLLEGYDKYPVFMDAENQILSMPPIINSHNTGKIDEKTKEVFIECSGHDLEILKKILNIICYTLSDMGGKIYQMKVNYKKPIITPDFSKEVMKISLENTNKLLGLNLKELDLKKLFEKMGYSYNKGQVFVPSYRTDILHEVDLMEDIAIAYGYDKFIPEIPNIAGTGEIDKREELKIKVAEILAGLGMLETSSYHLINLDSIKKFSLNEDEFVKIKDSKTEFEYLRKNLAIFLLKILGENVDVEYPQDIFQLGGVFNSDLSESEHLAIAGSPSNFTKLKQMLEYLSKMLDIKFEIYKTNIFEPCFIEGRVAEVKFNGKTLGYFGEVHPKILKNFKIKMPVALLEINLEELFNLIK